MNFNFFRNIHLMPILIIFLILFIIIVLKFKLHFDIKSFFHKGIYLKDDPYGARILTNDQGQGKTFSVVHSIIFEHGKDCIYFSNVFLNLPDYNITYFNGLRECVDIMYSIDKLSAEKKNKQVIIFYDELFSGVDDTHCPQELKTVLSQLRKRKIILYSTAQVWSKIPITIRKLCKYQIDCHKINLGIISLFYNQCHLAGNTMTYNADTQDYDAPIIYTKVFKATKIVSESYDTNQIIECNLFK